MSPWVLSLLLDCLHTIDIIAELNYIQHNLAKAVESAILLKIMLIQNKSTKIKSKAKLLLSVAFLVSLSIEVLM